MIAQSKSRGVAMRQSVQGHGLRYAERHHKPLTEDLPYNESVAARAGRGLATSQGANALVKA